MPKQKPPYEVGQHVWVKARVTRVAPHPTLQDTTLVTIALEGGHIDTLWMREGDDRLRARDAE